MREVILNELSQEAITEAPPTEPAMVPARPGRREFALFLQRLALGCAFAAVVLSAVLAGLALRRSLWRQTEELRFTWDIDNAFRIGNETLRRGYLDEYDEAAAGRPAGDYDIDYAPGRLAVATLWTRWVHLKAEGPISDWRLIADWHPGFYERALSLHATYTLCRPLLMFNSAMELIATAGMFALVWQWVRRRRSEMRAVVLGLIAALLLWFNPALLWDAHAWPQWDCWLLPFYLWALVAASADCWFVAGLLIAMGAMFKSQILIGMPLLILWPLFRGQLLAVVRLLIGLAFGAAVCASPFLVRADHATRWAGVAWVAGLVGAAVLLYLAVRHRWTGNRPWQRSGRIAAGGMAVVLVCWPLRGFGWIDGGVLAAALGAAVLAWMPPRVWPYALAAAVATALLLCPVAFGGSLNWFRVGMFSGSQASFDMSAGHDCNLAALLESQWHWHIMDPVFSVPPGNVADDLGNSFAAMDRHFSFTPGHPLVIPLRYVLVSGYVAVLLLCSVAAAMHDRQRSARFLIAVVTPWVVMFAVLPQMHERYLLWGACLGAALAGVSLGLVLLNLVITVIALGQIVDLVAGWKYPHDPTVRMMLAGWSPGIAWALLLAAAILLYQAIVPDRPALPADRD